MTKIYDKAGYEVFVAFDGSARVYELFASDTGSDYIGCADTLSEARSIAAKWVAERRAER